MCSNKLPSVLASLDAKKREAEQAEARLALLSRSFEQQKRQGTAETQRLWGELNAIARQRVKAEASGELRTFEQVKQYRARTATVEKKSKAMEREIARSGQQR